MAVQQPRVVVITGASAGVGRATVREFAQSYPGVAIGLIARGRQGLEAAANEVADLGGRALICALDVSDAEAVEKAAEEIEAAFGPIDIWINNAMVSVFSPVKEMKAEEFRRVIEVNYLGYVHGTLSALKRMRERDRGVIIQVGSALSYRSIPLQSAYCASKHAINGFTESLRTELMHDKSKVDVCLIQLPAVNTPQFGWVKSRLPKEAKPVAPIYDPEVPASAIRWLTQHPRKELQLGFSTLQATLGEKFAPEFADWYLSKTGYDSQQTSEPRDPSRESNLWEPVEGDHGAHGNFDREQRSLSLEFLVRRNLPVIALATAGFAALATGIWVSRRRSSTPEIGEIARPKRAQIDAQTAHA